MTSHIINNLSEIKDLLNGLSKENYTKKLEMLSGGTIGQHVRHILEFYQCLFSGLETGVANYDNRKRDLKLEEDLNFTSSTIDDLINKILDVKSDSSLILLVNYDLKSNESFKLNTTLFRELAYNLEHSIHHQALIKVAITEMQLTGIIKGGFGIAPSTIRFNSKNVHSNLYPN